MSCFIVKDSCLFDVLDLVKTYKSEIIGTLTDDEFLIKLAYINIKAYNKKYNEYKELNIINYQKNERHELTKLFNLLAYVYQCAEGEITKTEFFKSLENLSKSLVSKFDQKYIMGSDMKHERKLEDASNALRIYMKTKNIEYYWG